jgi:hypothetical protein
VTTVRRRFRARIRAVVTLPNGTRLAVRPFESFRVVPSLVEGRQAQGDLEKGRKVGVYEVILLLGEGGPPPLAQSPVRAQARSTEAKERTCQ